MRHMAESVRCCSWALDLHLGPVGLVDGLRGVQEGELGHGAASSASACAKIHGRSTGMQ